MWKLKRQIIEKYLPLWCRSELLEENRRLTKELEKQERKIERLNAYIDGIQDTLRFRQKIKIYGGSEKHERLERNCGCKEDIQL